MTNIPTKVFLSLMLGFFINCTAFAERYRISEDSFGETNAEKVESGVEATAVISQEVSEEPDDEDVISEKDIEPSQDIEPTQDIEPAQDIILEEPYEETHGRFIEESVDAETLAEPDEENELSVFEKEYLEGIEREKQEALELLRRNQGDNPVDVTDVSSGNYLDADASEAGQVEEGQSPYYIQIDAEGRPYITPFDPNLEKAARKSQQEKKLEFTDATIYKRNQEQKSLLNLPGAADPIAKSILMGGKDEFTDYFSEFSRFCCEGLINKHEEALEKGRAYFFEITEEDLPFRFKEGDSRYLLVKLPRTTRKNYPLRFRTFIRSYKNKGIKNGVFFPQIVTLDKEKQPLRIITGPLLKYVPENWMKYGYLEGVFEIDQTREREETYLLAKTNKKILKETSTIVTDEEELTIQHLSFGSFEIDILLD